MTNNDDVARLCAGIAFRISFLPVINSEELKSQPLGDDVDGLALLRKTFWKVRPDVFKLV